MLRCVCVCVCVCCSLPLEDLWAFLLEYDVDMGFVEADLPRSEDAQRFSEMQDEKREEDVPPPGETDAVVLVEDPDDFAYEPLEVAPIVSPFSLFAGTPPFSSSVSRHSLTHYQFFPVVLVSQKKEASWSDVQAKLDDFARVSLSAHSVLQQQWKDPKFLDLFQGTLSFATAHAHMNLESTVSTFFSLVQDTILENAQTMTPLLLPVFVNAIIIMVGSPLYFFFEVN